MSDFLPTVTLIGRPNVGKSALFNRFLKKRQALVASTPGLTRDRLIGGISWRGLQLRIVDTGGLQFTRDQPLAEAIGAQVKKAMQETDLAVLVCDVSEGLVPLDREVAEWIRRFGKPVVVAANKVDTLVRDLGVHEFSSLGFGIPQAVSSLHGRGIGDLLDLIVERLSPMQRARSSAENGPHSTSRTGPSVGLDEPIKLAIVGRPNVGKSSLVNRILNEERVLVDESPGTTRDPVEIHLSFRDRTYCLIDTAGVRSRRRIKNAVDSLARLKSLKTIRQADVCVAVLDVTEALRTDDLKLLDEVVSSGKPVCLVMNKWDLRERKTSLQQVAKEVASRAPFLRFAPILCTSAKTGFNVVQIVELARDLAQRAKHRIGPEERRRLLQRIQTDPKAPVALREAHLFRLLQVEGLPPTFRLLGKANRGWKATDIAYLEGIFRRELKMEGIPLRIQLRLWGRR